MKPLQLAVFLMLAATAALGQPTGAVPAQTTYRLNVLAFSPAPGTAGICPDTPLRITFDEPAKLGAGGKIRICDADSREVVETIDLADPAPVQTIGGLPGYRYHPVIVLGRVAAIYPRDGELAYGHRYWITVDPACFRGGRGPFAGVAAPVWTFATRASGRVRGAARLTVAADGSGDFCTVQGAMDFIPANNPAPVTVFIRKGIYTEMVHFEDKANVTIVGESQDQTTIQYATNARFNPLAHPYRRGVFSARHAGQLVVSNLTLRNLTPQGGSQAEAIIIDGTLQARAVLCRLSLYSYQDTLQVNGQAYVRDCHIEGDVDFLWGSGPCFFENCDFVALRSAGYYVQVRNPEGNHGFVFHRCGFEGRPGIAATYLARIDPGRFPHSEMVLIDCVLGECVGHVGWYAQGHGSATSSLHYWEHDSRSLAGKPVDVRARAAYSRQLDGFADAPLVAEYSNPVFVLGGWNPHR